MNLSLPKLAGKHFLFIGKGKEWKSFEKFCKSQLSPASLRNIYINDDNRNEMDEYLRGLDTSSTIVVKTAGYPGRLMPVGYITPTQIFFDCIKMLGLRSIGITGTKGKTTTSSLLAQVLKAAGKDVRLCGNMGSPMLDALENVSSNSIFVIEISSYQLNELQVSPDIAIITNLYRDHIDYHGSIQSYWEAKRNILRYMDEKCTVVFNPETSIIFDWLSGTKIKQININPAEDVNMMNAKLIGDHNKLNYLMVRAVADLFKINRKITYETFLNFEPIKHRLQLVREVQGITYINDAIGSNPEATIAGIKALVNTTATIGCIFLGGVDREYNYTDLVKSLVDNRIPNLVLFPDTGPIILSMLPDDYKPKILHCKNMKQAVNWASKHTPKNTICLLSTAAPSTVLWNDFEEKGNQFIDAVNKL